MRAMFAARLAVCLMATLACGPLSAQVEFVNDSYEASIQVTDEPMVLSGVAQGDLNWTYFAHTPAIPQTLVVTDQAKTITYVKGTDFVMGRGARIGRTASSAIPDGATVLASYRYSVWEGWTPYGYTVPGEGGAAANPMVGSMGGESLFDVLYPNQGAIEGYVGCGFQGWGDAKNGGCYQTFTAAQSGFIVIKARAFSINWSFQDQDIGNRVRAGIAPGTTTNRGDVTAWTEVAWGSAWSNIVVPVPAAGTYTLFIENHTPWSSGIWNSLWDYVKWSGGVIWITDGPREENVTETTADIVWDTDVSSDSTVGYDVHGAPYSFNPTFAEIVTHHVMHLTGLMPGTQYYYQVSSGSAGLTPALSGEKTFTTVAPIQPVLTNGDFEAVGPDGNPTFVPWSKFGGFDGVFPSVANPSTYGVWARSESHFAGAMASYGQKDMAGCLQRVSVEPGKTYAASAWIWTENNDGDPPTPLNRGAASNTQCRIGIDPTGGIDPNSANVVWGPWGSSQNWQPPYEQLGYQQVNAMAEIPLTSSVATVFLQVNHKWSMAWNRTAFDDVTLQQVLPVTTLGEAKTAPLGWLVDITNGGQGLVVSKAEWLDEGSPPAPAPYCWVEDDDRSNGIKVRLDQMGWSPQEIDAIQRGCRITLKGRTERRNLNDFYYGDVEIVASEVAIVSTGNSDPSPIGMSNKGAGGASVGIFRGATGGAGANNVGLVVKTAGKVVEQGISLGSPFAYYFVIDDGSNLSNPLATGGVGLKVWQPYDDYYWPDMPALDAMVSVTGVCCLEVYDPTPTLDGIPDGSGDEVLAPTIRMRDGRDVESIGP